MDNFNNTVKVGDHILFLEGRNNKPVAHDIFGKVILCNHPIKLGYAKVTKVKELDRVIIVDAEHIIKDLHYNIDYDEFMQVLPRFDFKIGFDEPFINHITNQKEHYILAYNLKNNACIVAETFTEKENRAVLFNSIELYLPGVNVFKFHRDKLIYKGNANITVIDSMRYFSSKSILEDYLKGIDLNNNDWMYCNRPLLLPYGNEFLCRLNKEDYDEYDFDKIFFDTMKLANPECLQIFKGFGKEILDKCRA